MHKILNKKKIIVILAIFVVANFLLPKTAFLALDGNLAEQLDPEVARLKGEIDQYQKQLSELDKQRQTYENSIRAKQQEITNLKNQTEILDDSIAKLALEVQQSELEIQKAQLEIENNQLEIKHKENEINGQKDQIGEVVRSIDQSQRGENYLEILILNGNIGNFFKEVNELQVLQQGLVNKLDTLNELKSDLDQKKQSLENRKGLLVKLRDSLNNKNDLLEQDKNVKINILSKSKGQEAEFQKLLAEVKAEQAAINSDIQNLELEARKKLQAKGQLPTDETGFIWPVPSRVVTAYFHDPRYPYRFVFEHPAIDIGKTPQGTPFRAIKSGYVARSKLNGTSYGYILLVHAGGLSSVYGHMSKSYVNEGDYVIQGQVIGLTGGRPGSTGAGNLTTGPHLHLEIRLNGIPVDPLQYLPN
ncbi:MAG: peptidoglycan DD-metalloendopeptidase family protein [Candidatus Komeilibacteria bacterium]|nr:peptidoglycan DD-metalloendopeptidase family protein [Candidatus Komeilibacteria bacterium]